MKKSAARPSEKNAAGLLWGATLAIACAFVLYVALTFGMDDTRLRPSDTVDFFEGWSVQSENGWADLESYLNGERYAVKGSSTIAARLPETLISTSALLFYNQNVSVAAWLDGEPLCSFGMEETPRFGSHFGAVWQLIDLPDDAGGKVLTLALHSSSQGFLDSPLLGTRDALILRVFWSLLPRILCCFLFALLGIVELLFTLYQWRTRTRHDHSDLYFGIFALTAATWVLTDGLIPQFFSPNRAICFYTCVFSFLLMPAIFALYVHTQLKAYKRMFQCVCAAFCLQALLGIVLSLLNIGYLDSGALTVAHATLALEIILVLWACFKRRESLEAREILIAMLCLICTSAVALGIFYLSMRRGNHQAYGNVFLVGLLSFCSLLTVTRVQGSLRTARQALKAEYYEQQAYTDFLTGLGNFAAYERAAKKADESGQPLTVMMFDLNDLKVINDSLGHDVGNTLLLAAAACLKRAFRLDDLYRLGGDEFAAVLPGVGSQSAAGALERFSEAVARHNAESGLSLHVACGMASRDGPSPSAKTLMGLADERMYANKRGEKEALSTR